MLPTPINTDLQQIPFIKTNECERPKFYAILNNIANRLMLKDTDGSYTKRYLNNDTPLILKTKRTCNAVFIKSFRSTKQNIKFPKIQYNDSKIITIHITEGTLKLTGNNKTEIIHAASSHLVNTKIANITMSTEKVPTNFVIVIHPARQKSQTPEKEQTPVRPLQIFLHKPLKYKAPSRYVINNVKITSLPENLAPTPRPKNKSPISYLRTTLTQNDFVDKTLFLDAEFVQTKIGLAPASVTIINYYGKVVFNRIIKPTEVVTNYVTSITGFDDVIINKGMPEKEALLMIHKIIEGKLLVGADLSNDLIVLKIDKEKLIGIRDLSTCKTLRNKMKIYDDRISLSKMVLFFFQQQIHKNIHTSLEDTKYIRDIYIQIDRDYIDDYYGFEEAITTSAVNHPPEIIEDTDSYGTPLMDENVNDFDIEMEPLPEPIIKSTVTVVEKQTLTQPPIKEPNMITIQVPEFIISSQNVKLTPKFISYINNVEQTNIQNTQQEIVVKYFPTEFK